MLKKIILLLTVLLYIFTINNVFAEESPKITSADYKKGVDVAKSNLDAARAKLNDGPPTEETLSNISNSEAALKIYQDNYNSALKEEAREAREAEAVRTEACNGTEDCFDKDSFMIKTSEFTFGGSGLKSTGDSKETLKNVFAKIIQKMMIALGIIALFVMTIGAGYIIMYRGNDEYLSKGKTIFIGGIVSLVVALSSYYIINMLGYVLYK